MPTFRSADQAMGRYLGELTRGVPGHDPYATRGVLYADLCPKCRRPGKWKEQDGVQRCQAERCGTIRPSEPAAVLKRLPRPHEFTGRRDGNASAELLAELGWVWQRLTLWEFRAFGIYIIEGSRERALATCATLWPRRTGGWSEWIVKELVRSARRKAERDLVRRGLMDPEDLAA